MNTTKKFERRLMIHVKFINTISSLDNPNDNLCDFLLKYMEFSSAALEKELEDHWVKYCVSSNFAAKVKEETIWHEMLKETLRVQEASDLQNYQVLHDYFKFIQAYGF